MTNEKEQDEIPKPKPTFEENQPRFLRGLLIFLAIGLLAGGVLLQSRMFKKQNKGTRRKASPLVRLNPPPAEAFTWIEDYDPANSIVSRIPPSSGLHRVGTRPQSFGHWLRFLPLKPGRPEVMLHTGKPKHNQNAHFAVIDIDKGKGDLQQCADAIIRLRAEYLRGAGRDGDIHFNFTSGDNCDWNKWVEGQRPVVDGNAVSWQVAGTKPGDRSRANFKKYLDTVFTYAGTRSLAGELAPVKDFWNMQIGDVFIHPGSPGHAVIVVDIIEYSTTGGKGFMLAQSFTPAQDLHILVNPSDLKAGPWYPVPERTTANPGLRTPEWTFSFNELMRFKEKAEKE